MAEKEVEFTTIYLYSRGENCVKEVIDFLLNSKCASLENVEEKSNDVEAITKYTYGDGSPTVNKENWLGNTRVHFILKLFDPDDIRYILGNNVIVLLSDEADINLIINVLRNKLRSSPFRKFIVIGKRCTHLLEEPLQNLITTRWSWNDRIAYHWSPDLPVTNNLWFHICGFTGENWPTRVSYNSEHIWYLKLEILRFFNSLLQVIYSNIRSLSNGTETNSVSLQTLSLEGFGPRRCSIHVVCSKDLLMQCNISNLSEFNSLLKEEVKQLACHLPGLIILCDEYLVFKHSVFYHLFEKREKEMYKELKSVNKENITEAVLHSLNIMSGMKYTGHYIKNELGIDKIKALRDHLRFRNVENDFWYVTGTIVKSPLGDGGKKEIQGENKVQETHSDNRIRDIHIDNRIGNIQLLKSLQGSLQEFTEELKNVRHLQENISENMKEMRKEMHNLKQKLDEVSLKTKE